MTLMHQKQSIEDTVSAEVRTWHGDNGIDIYLSTGYGPPLVWRLYEFEAKTPELLNQLQFYQNPDTRQSTVTNKYSPPYGLLKIDPSDDRHFEAYLEQLLERNTLENFGWVCYQEESLVDEGEFQEKLLDGICTLYLDTRDVSVSTAGSRRFRSRLTLPSSKVCFTTYFE